MILKTSRLLLEFVIVALAAVAVFVGISAWRLSTGPILLDFVTPHLVAALTPEDGAFQVELDRTVLIWEQDNKALEIHALGVRARDRQGEVIANVPEISVSFSATAMLRGLVAPTRINIIGPKLHLVRSVDGSFRMGLAPFGGTKETDGGEGGPEGVETPDGTETEDNAIPFLVRDLLAPPDPNRHMGYLEELQITDADLTFDDRHVGHSWRAPNADILLSRDVLGLRAEAWLDMDMRGREAHLNLVGIYNNRDENFNIAAGFDGIEPTELAAGMPSLAPLSVLKVAFEGTMRLTVKRSGVVGDIEIDLQSGAGGVEMPANIMRDLQIRSFRGSATVSEDFRQALFRDVRLVLADGLAVTFAGSVDNLADVNEFNASVGVEGLEMTKVGRYWPGNAAPGARDWITKNVTGGRISEVHAVISGRVRNAVDDDDGLGRVEITRVNGAMLFQGLTVTYLRGLPPAEDVRGGGIFNIDGFNFTIAKARIEDLQASGGRVLITGLRDELQYADITMGLSGELRTALRLLDYERLGYATKFGILPEKTDGHANIKMRFQMPLIANLGFDDVTMSTDAEIKDMRWGGALLDRDFTDGQLAITLNGERMQISGTGQFGDIPVDMRWTENFLESNKIRRHVVAHGIPTSDQVAEFGLDVMRPYVKGTLPLDVNYTAQRGGDDIVAFKADLMEAVMEIPQLDWRKEAGVPGKASLSLLVRDGAILELRDGAVEGGGFSGAGSVGFDPKTGQIISADIKKFSVDATDLAGTLKTDDKGWYQVTVSGAALDVSGFFEPGTRPGEFELPPIAATINIDRVFLRPERFLNDAHLKVAFNGEDWREIRFQGKLAHTTGKKKLATLTVDLHPEGNERRLIIASPDAGGVIWTFGISDDVVGGGLDIVGRIDDSKPKQPIEANVVITDYTLVDAPVMAQLLTLASLTGIGNLLSGEGIEFSRLEVPLRKNGDIVQVKDARAIGSELGFTMNGVLDLAADKADLGGTIVPAYTINSLLGNIPILGTLLVGEKGSGIFAASYTIKGPIDGPEISVNPIATLTPGFLRGIFGVPGGSIPNGEDDGSAAETYAPQSSDDGAATPEGFGR